MTRYSRDVLLASLVVSALAIGCVPNYKPPTASEPHAILKLRRTYEQTRGEQLSETLMLGESLAYHNAIHSAIASTAQADALLIHPVPTELSFRSSFSHTEMRHVLEHYTVQVPYQAMESYSCGSGTSYRSCSRPTTHYRSESKTRWVNRAVTVYDGSCEKGLRLVPSQGKTYLLQYTYQEPNVCSLSCFEQLGGSDGTVSQHPCSP